MIASFSCHDTIFVPNRDENFICARVYELMLKEVSINKLHDYEKRRMIMHFMKLVLPDNLALSISPRESVVDSNMMAINPKLGLIRRVNVLGFP